MSLTLKSTNGEIQLSPEDGTGAANVRVPRGGFLGDSGYSWVDETANRSAGVTYTNTAGKPIMISFFYGLFNNSSTASFTVDGITVTNKANSANQSGLGASFDRVIPNGSVYSYDVSSTSNNEYKFLELK